MSEREIEIENRIVEIEDSIQDLMYQIHISFDPIERDFFRNKISDLKSELKKLKAEYEELP